MPFNKGKGFGESGDGFVFKIILVPADFPTLIEADANLNVIYVCGTDPSVIDNDPTKTNTGQTIFFKKRYVWDVLTQQYYEIGGDDLWFDDGTYYKMANPRHLNMQSKTIYGGSLTAQTLKFRNNIIDDLGFEILANGMLRVNTVNYETLVLNDNDIPNRKFVIDEASKVIAKQQEFTVSTPDQRDFILSQVPSGAESLGFFRNGILQPPDAYSFAGTALTWGGTPALAVGDKMLAWFDWQAPSPGLTLGTYSGVLPVAGANLVVTAATLGLSDARQIVMSQLMGRATDQNWYFAGNTWGGATHDFNYTIPTLSDPNLGDLVIQVAGTASSVAGQPFKLIYYYQATNFLT
jgi:hypothetical protein